MAPLRSDVSMNLGGSDAVRLFHMSAWPLCLRIDVAAHFAPDLIGRSLSKLWTARGRLRAVLGHNMHNNIGHRGGLQHSRQGS